MVEPLGPAEAKRLILGILESGTLEFSQHTRDEMANDGIAEQEVFLVLRGGVVEPAETVEGTWRYRVRRERALGRKLESVYVVVLFRNEQWAVVVTTWRKTR